MLDKLFTNPGEKITKYAKIMVIIEVIASFISAIVASDEFEEFGPFIGILIGGIIVAYITSLFMAAFGELVQSSIDNKKVNEEILNEMKNK